MRVLLDAQITGADGIGRCTHQLVAALERRCRAVGDELIVEPPRQVPRYCLEEGEHLVRRAVSMGADVIHLMDYRVPLDTGGIPVVSTVHDLLRFSSEQACYSDEQFERRFGPGALRDLRTATSALEADGGPGPGPLHHRFVRAMTRRACLTSRFVFTPTRQVAGQLARAVPGSVPVHVAHWGVDHFPPAEPLPLALRGAPFILYVGQDRPHKRVGQLLEAYGVCEAARGGVRLVLAGRDFAQVPEGGISAPGVLRLGEVSDGMLAALFANAALSVHLADCEGFGLPPLEALSHGSVVLARDLPVMREILADQAVYTSAVDAADVARAVDRALAAADSPQRRRDRVRWARSFTWDACAARVSGLYREVLAS